MQQENTWVEFVAVKPLEKLWRDYPKKLTFRQRIDWCIRISYRIEIFNNNLNVHYFCRQQFSERQRLFGFQAIHYRCLESIIFFPVEIPCYPSGCCNSTLSMDLNYC